MEIDFYMNLISKRLDSSLSDEEQSQLESWLAQSEENRTLAKDLEEAWEVSGALGSTPEVDLDHEFSFLEAKMDEAEEETPPILLNDSPIEENQTGYNWLKISGIAASIAALMIVAYFLAPSEIENLPDDWKEVLASTGQKEVALPDGSKVILNKNSKLSYPENFAGAERSVRLEGEAFFKVQPDQEHPFIVRSGQQKIEVLGTSFNVRNYSGEPTSSVQVAEGKVRFTPTEGIEGLVLLPGNRATFNRASTEVHKEDKASPNGYGWASNALTYKNAPLGKICQELEGIYDVDIQLLDQEGRNCPFSGTFKQMTPRKILSQIAVVMGGELVENNGNEFVLKGIQCQ